MNIGQIRVEEVTILNGELSPSDGQKSVMKGYLCKSHPDLGFYKTDIKIQDSFRIGSKTIRVKYLIEEASPSKVVVTLVEWE